MNIFQDFAAKVSGFSKAKPNFAAFLRRFVA